MAAQEPGRIVTLVRRGTRPPFIILPGAGGGFSPYLRLASEVGERHNVHLVRAAGLMPNEEPERTVDAMASSALAALDAADLVPAVVFGWSMGGAVGWELCVRLAERGRLPDLVLVDSSPLPLTLTIGAQQRLRERVAGLLGPRPARAVLDRVRRTLDAHLLALAAYQTRRPYLGRVLLLTCTDDEIETRAQSTSRWRCLAPRLSVGRLAAGHFSVFDDDHLTGLTDRIGSFLAAPSAVGGAGDVRFAVGRTVALAEAPATDSDALACQRLPASRRTESRAARALLRSLLADGLGTDVAAAPIAARESGQPYLPERPDLAISLSHTQGHVAAAVGVGMAVGIDVQVPVPVSAGVIRRCCMPNVRGELETLPDADRELEFAWIWTVQEACVKATGAGLAGRPWTIPVRRAQRCGEWHGHRWLSLRDDSVVPVSVAYADHNRLIGHPTIRTKEAR
jgi:phosphopantetheinyl transferase/thioesterase domain-containing protein